MAKLTTKSRKSLPGKDFAGPGRSFPIPNKSHGRAALSMLHNAPKSEQASIRAKVKKKFPSIGKKK